MTAGGNLRVNIWRMSASTDDYAGGAVLTGTVLHYGLLARMQGNPDEQFLAQQGLETQRTFQMNVWPGNLDIKERDEVEIVFPPDYPYLNDRFRVVGVRFSDFNDPRKYMMLELNRWVLAHSEQ